jgi:signal transduction histidine kinase
MSASTRMPPVKFLLVDDREENLIALSAVLFRDGLQLVKASSAYAALEALLMHEFALAIIDVEMPDMNGLELAELIRQSERTRHLPLIFVTAGIHSGHDFLFRGYEAGAVDFLYKPIEPTVLRNKAETFFTLHRQTQQLAHQLELLRSQQKAAEEANRAKDQFLANVSHEIRTPMNAILGLTELCLDLATSEHQRRLLSAAGASARNLLLLINDLLDFSKITAGKLALDPTDFSLRSMLADTLDPLASRAQEKGIELACGVAPDVPERLRGDAGRLRQVLTNLIGNAVKFTEQGRVDVEVLLAVDAPRVGLRFVVRDTGIGIARDKQNAIFQAFEQEDSSTTRRYGGTGLGLTIAAQLAALMDGSIQVESDPGRGSTFCFAACFERAGAEAPGDTPSRTPLTPATTGAPMLRILVAEDNAFNVLLLRELLSRSGHELSFVTDGDAALELVSREQFDLLLLDLHLPKVDGFEIARTIREREAGTGERLPIVAVTARSSEQDRSRCRAEGMDGFLSKPIDSRSLDAAVARVASLIRARSSTIP